jgi:hypothetical protein
MNYWIINGDLYRAVELKTALYRYARNMKPEVGQRVGIRAFRMNKAEGEDMVRRCEAYRQTRIAEANAAAAAVADAHNAKVDADSRITPVGEPVEMDMSADLEADNVKAEREARRQ